MCEICERENLKLQFHHLIPKKYHSKKSAKKVFTVEEMKTRGIMVCKLCHKTIHKFFNHKKLAFELNTLEALLNTEKIKKHKEWAQKQKVKK
jgi:hypothetical protein